uniref:Protein TIFY n=1 Tax=Noccaea caerulescens TaxID=107243 RepID=A0A1J3HCL8_NOCCA
MATATVEDEPRAPVEVGCGNILGCGATDGEDHRRVEIGGNDTVQGAIAGSVAGEDGFSAEKSIDGARSSEADASTVIPTQLTIFFGGSVTVFEGIPAEKIQEILRIAAAAAKSIETKVSSTSVSPVPSSALNRAPSFSSTSTAASPAAQSFPVNPISFCRSAADLPIARRHSLQRFLEKRRDRLVNKNPYFVPPTEKEHVPIENADTSSLGAASVKEETPTA